MDDVAPRLAELDKRARRVAKEAQQLSAERAKFKSEAAEFEQWKQVQADKRRNPDKYLRADYGENYYDLITKLKVEGAVPADLIASEMDERFKSVEQKLAEKQAELDKKLSDYQAQELRAESQKYLDSAVAHAKANADKYKLLNHFGEADSVAREIQQHFAKTTKQLPDGSVEPGELLSPEAAAEAIEKRIADIAGKFKAYFEAEAAKTAPAPQKGKSVSTEFTQFAPKRTEPTQRRESSTPTDGEWTPPKNDRERLQRAYAAGEQHLASRQ